MKDRINLQRGKKVSLRCLIFFALFIMAYTFIFPSNVNAGCKWLTFWERKLCPDLTYGYITGWGFISCCGIGCDYWCNNCKGGCREPHDQAQAEKYCNHVQKLCRSGCELTSSTSGSQELKGMCNDACDREYDECVRSWGF
jgi:hypothetical protein